MKFCDGDGARITENSADEAHYDVSVCIHMAQSLHPI